MADEQAQQGRDRVREIVIQRLKEAGVQRPKAMTVSDCDALYRRLVDDLSYMSAENLRVLVDLLLEEVAGDPRRRLPPEVAIRHLARSLQAKPRTQAKIVTSWLRSIEGPKALAAGHGVELYRWLIQHGRPPGEYDMRQIRTRARDNDRHRKVIAENERAGRATPDELAWAERYAGDLQLVQQLVAEGAQKREAA
jgi:hypothetical protein